MADVFEIEIATPERLLAREKAIRAQIPAKEGYIGVLPDHAPLLSQLGIGAMTTPLPAIIASAWPSAAGSWRSTTTSSAC